MPFFGRHASSDTPLHEYIQRRVGRVLSWYCTGAVDRPETIAAINHDLAPILADAAAKFGYRLGPYVLRVQRVDHDGTVVVRIEHRDLS